MDFVVATFYVSEEESTRYLADGLLVIANGKIKAFGNYADRQAEYEIMPITAYPGKLIVPICEQVKPMMQKSVVHLSVGAGENAAV